MKSSEKKKCKRGHKFTKENTWVNNQGSRVCIACRNLRMREYRLRNPEEKKGHRNSHKTHCPKGHEYTEENTYVSKEKRHCRLCAKEYHTMLRFKRYGISKDEYDFLLKKQKNSCAICNTEFKDEPHIDHDHVTGNVRGLLCFACNTGIGQFYDNQDLLKKAINYLDAFSKTKGKK